MKERMKTRKIIEVAIKKQLRQLDTDAMYWRSQPYEARLAALEEIRQEYHRWKDDVQPGFQRVYRIVKR
jgi:hypothetical protein